MKHSRTGRTLGSEEFIEKAGQLLNRDLKKKNLGQKLRKVFKLYAPNGTKLNSFVVAQI